MTKCLTMPEQSGLAWRIVLLGAPGVGKGTQAALLSRCLGACHLSTGDVFRAARDRSRSKQTPAMATALDFMRRGHLVSDETVWEIVRERAVCLGCRSGFVLDGFPRTLAQAESLKLLLETKGLPLHVVLNYELPLPEIVSRLSGRRTCEKCNAIFHVFAQPPRKQGLCDHCGGRLCLREDDRPESIAVRLEAYERSTTPLIQFYRDLDLSSSVPATGSPEKIVRRAIASLEARRIAESSHLELSALGLEPNR